MRVPSSRQVRDGGDAALRDANARFGGGLREPVDAPACTVPRAELRAARDRLPRDLRAGLERMAANIERFHAVQVPPAEQWVEVEPGIEVGRVWRGLDRVGGLRARWARAYPSSLLMSAIPARLAGVGAWSSWPARPRPTGSSPLPCSVPPASMGVEEL